MTRLSKLEIEAFRAPCQLKVMHLTHLRSVKRYMLTQLIYANGKNVCGLSPGACSRSSLSKRAITVCILSACFIHTFVEKSVCMWSLAGRVPSNAI